MEECPHCVDKTFTTIWLHRLLNMGDIMGRRAHEAICDIVAVLRVTSTKIEQKHLLGQEQKAAKRGGGVSCDMLGQRVYRKLVENSSKTYRDASMTSCLGSDTSVRKSFMLSLGELDQTSRGPSCLANQLPSCFLRFQ